MGQWLFEHNTTTGQQWVLPCPHDTSGACELPLLGLRPAAACAADGPWEDRVTAAVRAFHEWLPTRFSRDDEKQIYRSFEFGDLATVIMAETRITVRPPKSLTLCTY